MKTLTAHDVIVYPLLQPTRTGILYLFENNHVRDKLKHCQLFNMLRLVILLNIADYSMANSVWKTNFDPEYDFPHVDFSRPVEVQYQED